MLDKNITEIKESFYTDIKSVSSLKDVEEIRIKYFSRNGLVSQLFEDLKDVVKEEKPILGKKLNLLRNEVSSYFEEVKERISSSSTSKENELDLTLPGKEYIVGGKHILTQTLDEIKSIFKGLGFSVANGPELESDYYNFESLNFPADHPARDTLRFPSKILPSFNEWHHIIRKRSQRQAFFGLLFLACWSYLDKNSIVKIKYNLPAGSDDMIP